MRGEGWAMDGQRRKAWAWEDFAEHCTCQTCVKLLPTVAMGMAMKRMPTCVPHTMHGSVSALNACKHENTCTV